MVKNKILFVEDNKSLRAMYKQGLEHICPEYEVVFAHHGEHALDIVNTHKEDFNLGSRLV